MESLLPQMRSSSIKDAGIKDDFLVARVVLNPLDGRANMQLHVTTAAIMLDYRQWVFPCFAQFFSPPAGLRLTAVTDTASSAAVYCTQMSKAGLLHAMDTHKTVDVHVQIGAPTIHVLLQKQPTAICVCLGSVMLHSTPVVSVPELAPTHGAPQTDVRHTPHTDVPQPPLIIISCHHAFGFATSQPAPHTNTALGCAGAALRPLQPHRCRAPY